MKKCPYCAEEIQDEAIKCKHCGEALDQEIGTKKIVGKRGSPVLRILGALLFLGGLAWGVYYYAYFDTSVAVPTTEILGQIVGGGRVNNLGLMQERQNNLMIGVVVAVVGLALVIVGQYAKLGGST